MPANNLSALLYNLTGQIITRTPQEELSLEEVQNKLAQALLHQNAATVRNQDFLFRNSDLYAQSGIGDARLKKMDDIASRISPSATSDVQVFMRSFPIRTSQVPGSVTEAAVGVRVTTKGPFRDSSGQDFYFDFVRTEKLIPLYIEGWAMPAILFKATFRSPRFKLANSLPVEVTKIYTVVADSVWVSAKVFDPSADAAYYCGLRVKGGKITLDAEPKIVSGKLTVSAATTVQCDLQLEQNSVFASDPSSPYGVDARDMKITLPASLQFSFKGATNKIINIAPASWTVFGSSGGFAYKGNHACAFFPFLSRLAVPVQYDATSFSVNSCKSPFFNLEGSAPVLGSWWSIPAAKINIAVPPEADGNGALIISCGPGLDGATVNLRDRRISLSAPFILAEPGRIGLTDLKSDGSGSSMTFDMWQDDVNRFGTTMECRLPKESLFLYNTAANGYEMAVGTTTCRMQIDRPVKVDGTAVSVVTKNSLWTLVAAKAKWQVTLVDNDVLMDNSPEGSKIPQARPYGLAMHNALFTVTPPNSVVLFAESNAEFTSLLKGKLYLGFGLFSYLPTLPDPYAANLGLLANQFQQSRQPVASGGLTEGSVTRLDSVVWLWLIGFVQWEQKDGSDKVGVSFHFAPLTAAFPVQKLSPAKQTSPQVSAPASYLDIAKVSPFAKAYAGQAQGSAAPQVRSMMLEQPASVVQSSGVEDFALLDVSSKANQMGVAFNFLNASQQAVIGRMFKVDVQDESNASVYPIQVNGLDVVTKGMFAHAFTVPQISWEPVFNLTAPDFPPNGKPKDVPFDPPAGFNYYQNDGFPTRVGNFSKELVPLSPIPLSKYLVETYRHRKDGRTYALFNLPFGMFTAAVLNGKSTQAQQPTIENVKPVFENYVNGGIQFELTAGSSFSDGDSNLFDGMTVQFFNINRPNGSAHDESTLGHSGTRIFNGEFLFNKSGLINRPASPVVKAGLSGYGASIFSDWHNTEAAFAQTSQALFNVTTGRTSHEVVQVKSMIYPWGVKVVRTFTLFRLANGYVCRVDSGWKAESDGKFDFRFRKAYAKADGTLDHYDDTYKEKNRYTFHPGIVHGVFNVKNIHEKPKSYTTASVDMVAVTFDADIELEHVAEGGKNDKVPSRGVVGYVQLAPQGEPIMPDDFIGLLAYENGTIGAEVQCTVQVAGTKQRMRLDRVDVSLATDALNNPVFVAAARGSVVLPKDGSWTMVRHQRGTGEVTPLPDELSVPLVRVGEWKKDIVVDPASVTNELVRIAYPGDLLRVPGVETINFGFLQNMNTQKVLFLTPSFKPTVESLLSKTPPLLADAFRLMNGNAIFPNVGDAESTFGSAIQLLSGVDTSKSPGDISEVFDKLAGASDLGSGVWKIMELDVKEEAGKIIDQGYKLIKDKANGAVNDLIRFDLPSFAYPLVDVTGLKIYVEYKVTSKAGKKNPSDYVDYDGKFDFNVESFASDMAKTWKGRMSSMQIVVDLGPMERMITIKGNFNSKKGTSTNFGSAADDKFELPSPEIEYSKELKPVIDILEVLAALSTGNYAEVMNKGLQIAMSNSANLWEYKFEANKDIPLIRFPMGDAYNQPSIPLKLEASLGLGVFFNAALKVTSDPKQLMPTAGAMFKFHGGLQVMCYSIAAATIYAVGNVDLELRADTSPKIALDMKFGFGAQLCVGLPVIGNVSILFMVGVEIYIDSNQAISVTAFMLFRGHAELLGGLVGVTITIEAKGTVEKLDADAPTNCKAQVTFGLDISIFLIINISFSETWGETRQIA